MNKLRAANALTTFFNRLAEARREDNGLSAVGERLQARKAIADGMLGAAGQPLRDLVVVAVAFLLVLHSCVGSVRWAFWLKDGAARIAQP